MPTDGSYQRRRKRLERVVTYAPKHVGLATGLAGAVASPNAWVASGMVVGGWVTDLWATYVSRKLTKGDSSDNKQ